MEQKLVPNLQIEKSQGFLNPSKIVEMGSFVCWFYPPPGRVRISVRLKHFWIVRHLCFRVVTFKTCGADNDSNTSCGRTTIIDGDISYCRLRSVDSRHTYLDFIAVAPSCLLIVFKWSKEALHSCSTFVSIAAISPKSTRDARVTAPICVRQTKRAYLFVLDYYIYIYIYVHLAGL